MASFEQRGGEADEETQEMDPGSPFSGMGLPGNGRADTGAFSCGDTVPLDDTLPLGDDEIEILETQLIGGAPNLDGDTQLLGGAPNLDGETQFLDDSENPAADVNRSGNDNRVEYEGTEVVGDDDEGTERTMLLGDEDGLSDDAATPFGVKCDDGEGETEDRSRMGTRTLPPLPRLSEGGMEEFAVAFEASTGDEGGSGPMRRRSFTEVRAAALRASGLAAACSMIPKTVDAEQIPSFCDNPSREEQDDSSVSGHSFGMREKYPGLGEQFADIRSGVPAGIENSDYCMQNGHKEQITKKSGNFTVRKLNFEEAISGNDESYGKMMDNGNSDTPHSLVHSQSAVGLSYVDSQAPGEQSQADALDAIDKFLSINVVGFSQEANPGKPCVVKTPPVSSAKGARSLSKMGHGSPVGKTGIFDWVDTLEDEGGGEFFSKSKDLFFGNSKHIKKSHTKPPNAFDKIGKHEGIYPKTDAKTMNITSLEPRPKQHNSIDSRTWASQVKTNGIACKEFAGQLNEEPTMQQSQKTHIGIGEEGVHDIGPDTQMAAEAMEALFCGPFAADHQGASDHPNTGNMVESANIHATRKKVSSSCISRKKRGTTASDTGGSSRSTRQSKRIKMLHAEANLHSSNSSKGSLNNSKLKRNLREKARIGSESSKSENLLFPFKSTKCKLLDGNSSESFRVEKVHEKLGRSSTSAKVDGIEKQALETGGDETNDCVKQPVETASNKVDGCAGSLVSTDKISFSKELVHREYLNVTPVAHRTRKTRKCKVYAVERLGSVSTCEETTKELEVKTIRAKRKQGRIVTGAPKQLSDHKKGSNQVEDHHHKHISSEFDVQKVIALPEKQWRNALLGDTMGHRKQRTARKSKSGNTDQAVSSKDLPLLSHVTEAVAPCPIQQDNSTVVENANLSLKSIKNKSKMDSAYLPSEADMAHDSVKGSFVASGVRTRLFTKSHANTSERDSGKGLKDGILTGACSSNIGHSTNMNEVHLQVVEPTDSMSLPSFHVKHDLQSLSDFQDAKGNATLQGTPKEKVQPSGSTSLTQQKLSAGSPVCTSVEPLSVSHKKGLSKSLIARELIRLGSAEAASIIGSKDLRRRRDITSVRVCLSHHLDDDIIKHQKKILARLGVPIVTSVSDATHFIADKFVRTRNMLEAMAVGRPVVTHLWLESCGQASCFLDEKNYILRDARKEKEIGFSMPASLARACQRPLLQGKRVFITTNVKPDRKLVADLVTAAQGQPMERLGRSAMKDDKLLDDLLVISCEEDFAICKPLLEKGAEVFSSELLLNGIVTQKLEYERHRLFLDHVKRTRSTVWLRNENGNRFLPVTKCT